MADVNSTLIDVCNEIALALQKKLNTTNKFKPINYGASIETIGSEANAIASDVKLGKKVYVGDNYVDGTFEGIDLTVTLSDEDQTFEPESGKYYKKVIVPAGASEVWDGTGIVVTTLSKLAKPVIELTGGGGGSFTLKTLSTDVNANPMGDVVAEITDESGTTDYDLSYYDEETINFTGNTATLVLKLTESNQRINVLVKKNNTTVYTLSSSSGQTTISIANGDVIEIVNNSTCFPAGTPVLMADGSQKLIETIEVGDKVKSFDLDTYEYGEAEVTEVVTGHTNRMAMLLLSDNSYIAMAEGHPLYTIEGWKSINKEGYPVLQIGDKVLGANGYAEILDMQVVDCEPTMVYSLSISSGQGGSTLQGTGLQRSFTAGDRVKLVYFAGNGITAAITHGGGAG